MSKSTQELRDIATETLIELCAPTTNPIQRLEAARALFNASSAELDREMWAKDKGSVTVEIDPL